MPPPPWAEGEQLVRLNAFFPIYLEHAEQGTYPQCWPELFIPWFASWPAEPIPLPNLNLPTPAPMIIDFAGLTVKEVATAKAKVKRAADWQTELATIRLMTEPEKAAWCLGRGVEKKQGVSARQNVFHDAEVNVFHIIAVALLVPMASKHAH